MDIAEVLVLVDREGLGSKDHPRVDKASGDHRNYRQLDHGKRGRLAAKRPTLC
jgi:hypothetical protein